MDWSKVAAKGKLAGAVMVSTYPTPNARDYKGAPGAGCRERGGHQSSLPAAIPGGQLNPRWVEWLMGWPIGWVNYEPLETAKFRKWRRSHGRS